MYFKAIFNDLHKNTCSRIVIPVITLVSRMLYHIIYRKYRKLNNKTYPTQHTYSVCLFFIL